VSTRPKPRRELTPGPWIAVIVVIVILATVYWWFSRDSAPEPQAVENTPSGSVDVPPATGETAESEPPVEAEAGVGAPEIEPEPDPEPESSPPVIEETTSPEIAAGQVRVLLTYTGDCWTEITDAAGRRLLFDLGRDGRSVELSGAEPLSVLFGNPGNVSVEVNGDDFDLPVTARPNQPLRLTIAGS
jgi:cytoskeleton protein RodZ